MLTEDYYVANKLMKGFIGSANVDTNSRLCMASSVAGHRRAFGADTVPGCYEDLDEADLLVLVGSNAAWCHPVLYQRMLANKQKRGARIVVIDPRRTDTVGDADLFLGLKPGTDTALFSAACWCISPTTARSTATTSSAHTTGFDEALARARSIAGSVGATALATGLSEARRRGVLPDVRQHAARGHDVFAGRQPVGAGHRQGQRHHQLPSRDRADRQARRVAVLADRPAQCDGRARGRRARQPARRAYGFHAAGHRPRAPVLEGAAHRHA